jgi:hypothetical protein
MKNKQYKRSFKSSLAETINFTKGIILFVIVFGILLKADFKPNLLSWFLLHYIMNEFEKLLKGEKE